MAYGDVTVLPPGVPENYFTKGSILLDWRDPSSGPVYGEVVFDSRGPVPPAGEAEPIKITMVKSPNPIGGSDLLPLLLVGGLALFLFLNKK